MSKMSETKLTEQEIEVIRNNRDNVDWSHISEYQKLSEDFIREFKDNIHWSYISAYQKLSEEFIREFKDDVDWYYISTHQKLSEDFIREFKNRVDWCYISGYQKLSEDFIREFRYNVDWCCIFMFQKLSEDFIREFKNKANWHNVSSYQELSEDFIREFRHNVNWNRISKCQKLSKKFIREFSLSIIKDKRTIEDKRNEMMDYANKHNLKFENDTLFAFREHDKWNRGVYNKTIYYDEPGYYKDWHCDLNPKNENSFGLGIFPQGNTPVSVSVEDWGVVVNDSKKARVLAFTKLNKVLFMSYAIGKIVYGFDTSEDSRFLSILEEWLGENKESQVREIALFVEDACNAETFQEHWCEQYYSGNGPTPAVFGVSLSASISECSNTTIAELNRISVVTLEVKKKFFEKWNKMPESFRNRISSELNEPEVFILWTSS